MDLSGLLKFYQGSNLILSFTIDHYISRMNIIMAKNWPFWILVEILLSTRSYYSPIHESRNLPVLHIQTGHRVPENYEADFL